MALGLLKVLYIVLVVIAVIIQLLLYRNKNELKNGVFIINMLFGIILSYMIFSSLPTNFTNQRILAIVWGLIATTAVILKLKSEKLIMASKIMLSVSIIGGFFQLFI